MLEDISETSLEVVHTVLGPVSTQELGIVLTHETLLSVIPGAELAPEIVMDESRQFEILKHALTEFHRLGGETIVDRGGMFRGRNVQLYRTLSKETNVHIIASTGLGPASMVGSYFTTQQTEPPGPMPLDRLADMYAKEITNGTVIPRRERTGPAGLICTEASSEGITEFEEHLYRASAQAALKTGASVSIQVGKDPKYEVNILEKEGLDLSRVIVGGLDRLDMDEREEVFTFAHRGAKVALDHVGWTPHEGYVSDDRRVQLVLELFEQGFGDRVLISSNAVGHAIGHEAPQLGFDHLLRTFIPMLRKAGATDEQIKQVLVKNPAQVLTLKGDTGVFRPDVEGVDITWVK